MLLSPPRLAALSAIVPVLVAYADTPWRTLGQKFRVHRWAERLVLLSVELNLLLLWLLARVFLGRDLSLAPAGAEAAFTWAGAVLAWAGAVLAVWARVVLGRWFSGSFGVKEGHELVTRGPYAIVRHPMYTGLVLLGAGFGLAWDSAVTLGIALLYAVPFWLHTMIEEQLFEAHFGDAWRAYRSRVPRLVPRLVPGWPARAVGTKARATPSPPR